MESARLHWSERALEALLAAYLALIVAYSLNYVSELRRRAAGDPAFGLDEPDEPALGRAEPYVSPGLPGPLGPWRHS